MRQRAADVCAMVEQLADEQPRQKSRLITASFTGRRSLQVSMSRE